MESSLGTKDFRVNRIAWFVLVALTISTYFIAEQSDWSSAARPVIVASMIAKFLVIYFIFMEMKHSYVTWWCIGGVYSLGMGTLFLSLL